jgi:hypothetical protein
MKRFHRLPKDPCLGPPFSLRPPRLPTGAATSGAVGVAGAAELWAGRRWNGRWWWYNGDVMGVSIYNILTYRTLQRYIGRTCLVARMQLNTNIIRGLVKRAQLLWNVHNISETCTTSLKRAQHLWNVHICNIWKHSVGAVKHVIPITI